MLGWIFVAFFLSLILKVKSSKMDAHGGYDVTLVSVMPGKYKCPLCKLLMRAPIQTYHGEMACESCYVDAVKDSNNICPIDNEEIEIQNGEMFFKDNHARREVLQLECYCSNKKNGCDWQGVVMDIEEHSTNCLYKEVSCTECHDFILKKDMEIHKTNTCKFRVIKCPHCAGRYDAQSIEEHEVSCHMKPMECPYKCGQSLMLNQLFQHVEICPMILNGKICPYEVVGCKSHPQNSVELSDHMQMAGRMHAAFAVSLITSLRNVNENMKHDLMREQNLRAEMAAQVEEQEIKRAALETEMQKIKDKLSTIQQEGENLKEKCEASEQKVLGDIEEIDVQIEQESLDDIERKLAEIKTKYDEIDEKVRSGTSGQSATGGAKAEEVKEVTKRIGQLENQNALLTASLSDLDLKLQLFENTSYDGRQLWKVDNVMHRMNQAVTGKVTALHSAPCFEKMGGYKFCTRLYLNGDGMGRGTHVSLFFVVMKSEYDALLDWPFNKRVTFRLINPYNKDESARESFIPDKNSSSFRQPQKDMNIAAGCPMFLRKDRLPQFIMDDVIYIECSIGT